MIEAKGTDGGVKFADGTVQTTSASGALLGVAHDQTLIGGGTSASPLGVASPLMVRDLDNPVRLPVYFTRDQGNDPYIVPAGKRLVIEFVSGFIGISDDVQFQARKIFPVRFNLNASQSQLIFVVGDLDTLLGGGRTYGVSQTLRLYASPGTVIQLFPSSIAQFGSLAISGYFVDVPVAESSTPR